MGLISRGRENLLDFLELRQVLSTHPGTSGTRSGGLGNGGRTLEFLSPFLWRAPPLEMRREGPEFFPDHAGKGPLLSNFSRKRCSSGCGRDSRASSQVDTGMSGNFLSCSKGVKDPLKIPEVRWDSPETHHRKWSSSRQEERTSWIFSS